jgi:phage terminase large subunit GpA-like protein
MRTNTNTLRQDALRVLAPPPRLTVSEWADNHRRLSPESSAEPGQFRTSRAEYQRGIMDAVTEPAVERVVVMSSAQVGKTAILENVTGYFISQDPAPLLVLMPTLEMAQAFSKDRLSTMLRDTPILRDKVQDPRARDSGNTMLHKTFAGGHITLTGANSPANLASRPIRIVLADEIDRYPASAGSEGDPVRLAEKRTATFWNRKIILTSTPTIKGLSRIEHAFENSDQRRFHVPCPDCGELQVLKWANVRWDEGKPETAHYACEHCGSCIDERFKTRMLMGGQWIAEAPFRGTAGFHLNELYSPWRRWSDVAADFLQAKAGGTEMLKTWVNTSLGEPWEDQGDAVEAVGLMARVEDYTRDDLEPLAITAGADVQKDRIEVSVIAWGAQEESWVLEHAILPGDTARPDVWADLDALLSDYSLQAAAIDSGFNASMVYAFCERRRYAYAVKGASGFDRPIVEDATKRARRLRNRRKVGGSPVQIIGVDQAKVIIHSRLRIIQPGPGYVHFSADSCDEEYFAQLAAEKLITKHRMGRATQEWVQQRPRNEALDAFVYALAALRLWGGLEQAASRKLRAASATEAGEPPPLSPARQRLEAINQKRRRLMNGGAGGFVSSWRNT